MKTHVLGGRRDMIECPSCKTPNWFRPEPIEYGHKTIIRHFKCKNCGEEYKYRYQCNENNTVKCFHNKFGEKII